MPHQRPTRRPVLVLSIIIAGCGGQTALDTDAGSPRDGDVAEQVTYGAMAFATGMYRIGVFKRDEGLDRCTYVGFVGPVDDPMTSVDLPDRWAIEVAWRGEAAACDEIDAGLPDGVEGPNSITGRCWWEEPICEIDVDLVLEFVTGPDEPLRADDILLPGSGCD